MRIRSILLILSFLSLIAIAAAGFYYFFSVREYELANAHRRAASQARIIHSRFSNYLVENSRTVRALAGLEGIRAALAEPKVDRLEAANRLLDHFRLSLDVDVCYLMDKSGLTVASSNRFAADSFVGKNFSFRPYFKEAMNGFPSKYLALGSTSLKRGVYYSYPVSSDQGPGPLGVVVIKAAISKLEETMVGSQEDITFLVGPHDIIFSSNRPDWLFKTLWPKTEMEIARIEVSRQFGTGPWEWTGITPMGEHLVADAEGRQFLYYSHAVETYGGWSVGYLHNLRGMTESILTPLATTTGLIIFGLFVMAGLVVYVLYSKAGHELARRERAELDLRVAQEKLSIYSKDLERQVEQRTREIAGFLEYTPAVVYMKDLEGRYTLVNSRWEQLFGYSKEDALGRNLHQVFDPETADQFRTNDLRVLNHKLPYQAEESFPVDGRRHDYLSVRFPILDTEGEVTRLCGISVDITDLKKAQERLHRLSGSIMASQEQERTAIARELHDELGQVLTALRMDGVWLRERLAESHPEASLRAAKICKLIDQTISDVRHIATRLRPPALDDLGLVDALEWFTTDFEERTGIACVYTHYDIPPVDSVLAIAAYRVAQEALTNVTRHARADHVEVTLRAETGELTLTVEDDGRGFEIPEPDEHQSWGLAGMRERASLAGGDLEIRTRPGRGTRVTLRLPLDQEVAV